MAWRGAGSACLDQLMERTRRIFACVKQLDLSGSTHESVQEPFPPLLACI